MKITIQALFFSFFILMLSCSKKTAVEPTTNVGQECVYETVPGKALVTSISLATGSEYKNMPYNGYIVKYKFIPASSYANVDFENNEYTYYITSGSSQRALPSREYIKKHQVEVGGEYQMSAKVISNGTCVPILFESQSLPNELIATAESSGNAQSPVALDGCDYEEVKGKLLVESVEKIGDANHSELGYQEYKIQYKFLPNNSLEESHIYAEFTDEVWTHSVVYQGKVVNPGQEYVEKYDVKKGALYGGSMYLLREGNCLPFKINSTELPSNDVSEIIVSEIQVPVDKLNYASNEPLSFEFNPIVNAPYLDWEPTDCKYIDVEGYIRVVSVNKLPQDNTTEYLPYIGYSVKYVFTPLYEYDSSLLDVNKTHEFYLLEGDRMVMPGPDYIKKYDIGVNTTRQVSVSYPVAGECERLKIVGGFPNDLTEFFKN